MDNKLEPDSIAVHEAEISQETTRPSRDVLVSLFRGTGILEGVSYLLLLFVAMPVKYGLKEPILVEIIGAAHGFLFVAYLFLAALTTWLRRWPAWVFLQAFLASLLPFGTFWMDRRIASRMSLDSKRAA